MDTEKPLAGALRVVREFDDYRGNVCLECIDTESVCEICAGEARIIARESGMAELVEAVEAAALDEENTPLGRVTIDANDWRLIVAAARRVREG